MVPVNTERTYEDLTITSPQERLRIFGQKDHIRSYGRDFIDRIKETGFKASTYTPFDILNKEDAVRMGIAKGTDELFYCLKY